MSPPILAQELIDAIISNFQDSKWDLRNFTLICRQWLHPTRRYLFRDIHLPALAHYHDGRGPPSSGVPYSKRLYSILQESPHLAEYIREVAVYDAKYLSEQDWIRTDKTLPFLLQMLVKLQKIHFHRLDWRDFSSSDPLKQSICSVLGLPTLSTLEISGGGYFIGMNELESFLCHAKYLNRLSITGCATWCRGDSEAGQVLEPLNQTQLVDLQLNCFQFEIFINWLLGPRSVFTVSHVTALDIHGVSDGKVINPLLHAIGGSLKTCRLDAWRYGEST
jgi:hypothetical protein